MSLWDVFLINDKHGRAQLAVVSGGELDKRQAKEAMGASLSAAFLQAFGSIPTSRFLP